MHQCGRLHETVRTGCLHTNQHWCLLSALILVNTDVYVRKRSDRCMIEVLKSRHSQRLSSSLLISQGRCDSTRAFPSWHYMHQLSFISFKIFFFFLVLFNWCNASFSANCKLVLSPHYHSKSQILSLSYKGSIASLRSRADLFDCVRREPTSHGLRHLFKDFASRTGPLKRDL